MKHSIFEDFANKKALQFCNTEQKHQVVAVLVKGGKVVNFGCSQTRYSRSRSYFLNSLHAEQNLIDKSTADELFGAKIYVYRFNNSSSPSAREAKCSIPCLLCQHSLKQFGVSRVCCLDQNNNQLILKNRDLSELVLEPDLLTKRFLEKNLMMHYLDTDGKFCAKDFSL